MKPVEPPLIIDQGFEEEFEYWLEVEHPSLPAGVRILIAVPWQSEGAYEVAEMQDALAGARQVAERIMGMLSQ